MKFPVKYRVLTCLLLLLFVFLLMCLPVFASFEFRPKDVFPAYGSAPLNSNVVTDLISTFTLQSQLGFVDNVSFSSLIFDPSSFKLVLLASSSSLSVSLDSSTITFSGLTYFYSWSSSTGWFYSYSSNSYSCDPRYIFASSSTIPATSFGSSFTGINPYALYGSSSYNVGDVYNYYYSLLNLPSDVSEAFSEGYSEGYSVAESEAYADGYNDGFDTGFDYGYQFGYEDGHYDGVQTGIEYGKGLGYVEGYDEGYEDGLDDGYSTGYNRGLDHGFSDGFNEGFEEGSAAQAEAWPHDTSVVTENVYYDRVELSISDIFSSISSTPKNIIETGFDLNIFGISIAGLLSTLIVLVIVIFIIRRVK